MNWAKILNALANFTVTGASAAAATASSSPEAQVAASIAGVISLILGVVATVKNSQ